MIICVCNNLSTEDILKLVEEGSASHSKDVYNAVNSGSKPCSFCPKNINLFIKGVVKCMQI